LDKEIDAFLDDNPSQHGYVAVVEITFMLFSVHCFFLKNSWGYSREMYFCFYGERQENQQ
jgi:hypothetical protein